MPDFLSLHEQLRRRTPRIPLTVLLIGANLLVFVAMLVMGAGLWHSSNEIQLAWGQISARRRRMVNGGGLVARCFCISAPCIC